jgi:hypothetical protein
LQKQVNLGKYSPGGEAAVINLLFLGEDDWLIGGWSVVIQERATLRKEPKTEVARSPSSTPA